MTLVRSEEWRVKEENSRRQNIAIDVAFKFGGSGAKKSERSSTGKKC